MCSVSREAGDKDVLSIYEFLLRPPPPRWPC
mgnify:CR=1